MFKVMDNPILIENGSDTDQQLAKSIANGSVGTVSRGTPIIDELWSGEIRPFEMMKSNGLFLVFIGIEDGTDSGLKRLNKHMSVSRSLAGINTLKKLEIGFDFGFMLFQPSTTFRSLNENLDFLEKICGDGYTPLTFIKLMPFYETRIEKELFAEGRLKSEPGNLDYDFP